MKETKLKRKLRLWQERNYSDNGNLYIKSYNNPYVKGILGADIKLTLWQRVQILFCGGVCVLIYGKDVGKNNE